MKLKVRPAVASDLPFIISTWLRGLYYGHPFYKQIDKDAYYAIYPKIIELLLSRSLVNIACLADDEDVAIGYCISEGDRLHWIYCKNAFRKQGVAKTLLPAGIRSVTHITKPGDVLRKKLGLKFIPFI